MEVEVEPITEAVDSAAVAEVKKAAVEALMIVNTAGVLMLHCMSIFYSHKLC